MARAKVAAMDVVWKEYKTSSHSLIAPGSKYVLNPEPSTHAHETNLIHSIRTLVNYTTLKQQTK